MACRARRYGDQMLCVCGRAWDADDAEPPVCPNQAQGHPLRSGKTILLHRPTGRRYVVDVATTFGVSLSGLLGGDRRLVSPDALQNAEVWGVEYA